MEGYPASRQSEFKLRLSPFFFSLFFFGGGGGGGGGGGALSSFVSLLFRVVCLFVCLFCIIVWSLRFRRFVILAVISHD